jgi:hypothetical protein
MWTLPSLNISERSKELPYSRQWWSGTDASTPNEFASRSRSTLSMTEVLPTLTTRGLGSATLPNMHSRALRPPCIDRPLLLQVGADA